MMKASTGVLVLIALFQLHSPISFSGAFCPIGTTSISKSYKLSSKKFIPTAIPRSKIKENIEYDDDNGDEDDEDDDDGYFGDEESTKRRIPGRNTRRPPGYWTEISNIETELREFWISVNVHVRDSDPPPIPNEALLNHFNRHDLRYGIYSHGGREIISEVLNGARIMPGKWSVAVQQSPELKQLLSPGNPKSDGLSKEIPPMPFQVRKRIEANLNLNGNGGNGEINSIELSEEDDPIKLYYENRWSHRNGRKPKGHWTKELVLADL